MRTCAIIHPLHLELETAKYFGSKWARKLRFTPGRHTIDDPELLPPLFPSRMTEGHPYGSLHGTIEAQPRCSLTTRGLTRSPVLR
jgi:hypothetical protein